MNGDDTLEITRASDGRKSEEDLGTVVAEDEQRVYEIDATVEKSLRRKLDRRLMVLLFTAYLLAFLDRSNIGNAQTAGMGKALGFDDEKYQVRFHCWRQVHLGEPWMLTVVVAIDYLLHPVQ